jgi:CRP-like cAMP-binding protein
MMSELHPESRGTQLGAAEERAWGASFLGSLPPKVQADLRRSALPLTIPSGNVIYHELDQPRLMLVVAGLMRVGATSTDGRKATIRYARAKDCIGTLSVVADQQEVTVEAVTTAEVLLLNVNQMRYFARTEPEVGWLLAREIGKVHTEVFDMMSSTIFRSVRQRLARHLLDLAVRQDMQLVVTQDQQEMADAIGSVREVVGRAIRDLRERGLVSRCDLGLSLDNPEALLSLSLGT